MFTLTAACLHYYLLICLLFKDGIPYLRPSDELKIKDIISDRQSLRQTQTTPNGTPFVVPEKDRDFMEEIYKKVETFLNSQESQELLLEGYNGFQRRLIYNTVKPKFSSDYCFHMETVMPKDKSDRDRSIKLSKVQADEQKKMEQEREQKEFDDLNVAVGFSKVIRKISESQKLVVGHNMLLDILYTIQQFVAPLPEDYEEFKEVMKSALPKVIGNVQFCTLDIVKLRILVAKKIMKKNRETLFTFMLHSAKLLSF